MRLVQTRAASGAIPAGLRAVMRAVRAGGTPSAHGVAAAGAATNHAPAWTASAAVRAVPVMPDVRLAFARARECVGLLIFALVIRCSVRPSIGPFAHKIYNRTSQCPWNTRVYASLEHVTNHPLRGLTWPPNGQYLKKKKKKKRYVNLTDVIHVRLIKQQHIRCTTISDNNVT